MFVVCPLRITMFKKHTYEQMTFNTRTTITQRDIQVTSLDLFSYRKGKSLKDMLVKAENLKGCGTTQWAHSRSRVGLSTPF